MGDLLNHSSVLIVSDDTEFARTIAARWQSERHVPEITMVTSDVWRAGSVSGYDLVIVGPVRQRRARVDSSPPERLSRNGRRISWPKTKRTISALRTRHPHLLVIPRQDGWAGALILVSMEALRRT